ncbi:MAG: M20/M25/M40 family metallo-hydrolase [Pirellulales bacterium]
MAVAACLGGLAPPPLLAEETAVATEASAEIIEKRLFEAVRYLASDELEGRGVGTKGLDLAADYIAQQFIDVGLNTRLYDGTAFQSFQVTVGSSLGGTNHVTLVGPATDEQPGGHRIELKLGEDFTPLALGGSGVLDLPLVFAGYGITAKDLDYDDYAGLDVEGKAVIVLRHEPQQADPHSSFDGKRHSQHAPFVRKLSNAYEHGAAAVVFVTDDYEIRDKVDQARKLWQDAIDELAAANARFQQQAEQSGAATLDVVEAHRLEVEKLLERIRELGERLPAQYDPLLNFQSGGGGDARRLPVVHCRRGVLASLFEGSQLDLAELERAIDSGPTPHSRELAGWRLAGEINVDREEAEVKNVVGVLEGAGPLADETIVVGAHYDHLGLGGDGSRAPGKQEIHNGADDNASGTAVLIEVARNLARREPRLPRRVVFIAFTGEERGLLGSARYCADPLVPMDKTIAMLNMDMVGRLDEDKLIIQGVDTAAEFGPLIDGMNERFGFQLTRQSGGFGPSDHASFYAKQVPVMHLFTGTHPDYHLPSDDYDKLNLPGMRRIADMMTQVVVQLAQTGSRPQYVEIAARPMGGGDRPYFGSIPDFAQQAPGYAISGVANQSPAQKAGLKAGDVIVRFGESKIGGLEDFDSALRKYKAGDKVSVVVQRDGKEVAMEVVLGEPR